MQQVFCIYIKLLACVVLGTHKNGSYSWYTFLPIVLPYPARYEGFCLVLVFLVLSCFVSCLLETFSFLNRKQMGVNLRDRGGGGGGRELEGIERDHIVAGLYYMREESAFNKIKNR